MKSANNLRERKELRDFVEKLQGKHINVRLLGRNYNGFVQSVGLIEGNTVSVRLHNEPHFIRFMNVREFDVVKDEIILVGHIEGLIRVIA